MGDLMDFLARSPQVRLITRVLLVRGAARDVLDTRVRRDLERDLEQVLATRITEATKVYQETQTDPVAFGKRVR